MPRASALSSTVDPLLIPQLIPACRRVRREAARPPWGGALPEGRMGLRSNAGGSGRVAYLLLLGSFWSEIKVLYFIPPIDGVSSCQTLPA